VDTAIATPLTAAFWNGSLNSVMAQSNGSTVSNWQAASGSVANQGLIPTGVALTFDGIGTLPASLSLGANMAAAGLTATANNTGALNLADSYTLSLGASGLTVANGAGAVSLANPITLTAAQTWAINSANPVAVSGAVGGTVTLTKTGTGTLTFSGANGFTGNTTISTGGIINYQNGTAFGSNTSITVNSGATAQVQGGILGKAAVTKTLTLNGTGVSSNGALQNVSGNNTYGNRWALGSAATIASDSGTLTLSNTTAMSSSQALTLAGAGNGVIVTPITGATASIVKSGAGTWTLSGANTFTSGASVDAGTLLVNNTASNGTGTGAVTVASLATLGGIGSVGGSLSIASGGIVAPGVTVGTLTVGGNTTIGGTYACDVNGAASDVLAITGNLDLTGSTLAVSATAPSQTSYTVATYTGTLIGTFTASPALPSGYTLDYATSGQIKLVSGAPPASAYDAFASVIPNAADRDPTDDPDADGISNLAEFVLGGNPTISSQAILPTQVIDATNIVLSYKRTDASEEAPATSSIGQYSTDLVNWTNVTPALVNENGTAADDMSVTVPRSNAVNGKLFVRVRFVK